MATFLDTVLMTMQLKEKREFSLSDMIDRDS